MGDEDLCGGQEETNEIMVATPGAVTFARAVKKVTRRKEVGGGFGELGNMGPVEQVQGP